jgi:hypothetical protein
VVQKKKKKKEDTEENSILGVIKENFNFFERCRFNSKLFLRTYSQGVNHVLWMLRRFKLKTKSFLCWK